MDICIYRSKFIIQNGLTMEEEPRHKKGQPRNITPEFCLHHTAEQKYQIPFNDLNKFSCKDPGIIG